MFLTFEERIALPPAVVYAYFRSPEDWVRLYGAFGAVERLEDGWRSVRLQGFPFPLVAKIVVDEPERRVRWTFRGFWEGEGEVRFAPSEGGVIVSGHEDIRPRGLRWLGPVAEWAYLDRRFRAIWALGFRRLHKQAARAHAGVAVMAAS